MLKSSAVNENDKPMGFVPPVEVSHEMSVGNEPPDTFLMMDDGSRVTFREASHNVIVLGTTGSGKTSNIILPGFYRMVKAGFAGVVVDVKGNVANDVRAIANECGRLADVVEFGVGSEATPVNLFAGADAFQRQRLIKSLFRQDYSDRYNSSFYEEGIQKVIDCLELYLNMCRKLNRPFVMDVFMRLVSDYKFAYAMHKFYREKYHDASNPDELDLVQRIDADPLHYILPKGKEPSKRLKAYDEQNSYRMHHIRSGMWQFLSAPGIPQAFFAPVDTNFDIARRVYDENKIVILRLSTHTGMPGELVSRIVMREYYDATYQRGKSLPEGKFTFCVADEVQDFYSSASDDPLNDNAFVAKCREFNCINIYGTQSVAAMCSRAKNGEDDVQALVSNCNVRVFLYSDDLKTMALAPRGYHDLDRLPKQAAVLTKFDVANREHVCGIVKASRMFRETQEIITRQKTILPDTSPHPSMEAMSEEEAQAYTKNLNNECAHFLGKATEEAQVQEDNETTDAQDAEEESPLTKSRKCFREILFYIEKLAEIHYASLNRLADHALVAQLYNNVKIYLERHIQDELEEVSNTLLCNYEREKEEKERKLRRLEHRKERIVEIEQYERMIAAYYLRKLDDWCALEETRKMADDNGLSPRELNGKFLSKEFPDFFTVGENTRISLPRGWIGVMCATLYYLRLGGLGASISSMDVRLVEQMGKVRPMLDYNEKDKRNSAQLLVLEKLNDAILLTCSICGDEITSTDHSTLFCERHFDECFPWQDVPDSGFFLP